MLLHQAFSSAVVLSLTLPAASGQRPAASYASDAPIAPSSKWLVNYDTEGCTLSRTFGAGDEQTTIKFVRYAPSADSTLIIVGNMWCVKQPHPSIQFLFGDNGEPISSQAMAGTSGGTSALFLIGRLDNFDYSKNNNFRPAERTSFDKITPETEGVVKTVSLKFKDRWRVFALGSMARPMVELQKCTDELVRSWGLDSE